MTEWMTYPFKREDIMCENEKKYIGIGMHHCYVSLINSHCVVHQQKRGGDVVTLCRRIWRVIVKLFVWQIFIINHMTALKHTLRLQMCHRTNTHSGNLKARNTSWLALLIRKSWVFFFQPVLKATLDTFIRIHQHYSDRPYQIICRHNWLWVKN